ncbi:ArsR/SmtB family transcription factor [Oceanirhabdus sp. W0125-5]|uniref:ArsR/SmtB family transcription factor n=1 Tax=Oceanirhabdus sp. W0125-5 TaxID=2999116 RepID=UPI0022F2BF18|nr:metalloregulator ArsR/SmtB family transcription factor [Oceanirhabdus sp. W0125-5]WBW96670.1 metalloregulator ArsR/SmtB family transcription factor [Oceanirhabdus sp. W0125-5]
MEKKVEVFKALADSNRLKILDMLSCGELCVCDLIEGLELTQSTVSHHMKILKQADLVKSNKIGKWTKYSINKDTFEDIENFIKYISTFKDDCICNKVIKKNCD